MKIRRYFRTIAAVTLALALTGLAGQAETDDQRVWMNAADGQAATAETQEAAIPPTKSTTQQKPSLNQLMHKVIFWVRIRPHKEQRWSHPPEGQAGGSGTIKSLKSLWFPFLPLFLSQAFFLLLFSCSVVSNSL